MNFGQLVNSLAGKAGIDLNSQAMKDILSNAELSKITVPAEITTALEGNLLTLDSAKNNPDIKKHFFAQAYNGLDSELNRFMDEIELDDTVKGELSGEKSSTKRAVMLAKKIQELEQKKSATGKKTEQTDLQKRIDELQAAQAKLVNDHKTEVQRIQEESSNNLTNLLIKNTLGSYNYALPKEMPADAKVATAMTLLQNELAAKEVKIVNDNGALKLLRKDGTEFYDASNKKLDYKAFVDQVLGQNKLLQTTEDSANNKQNNTQQQQTHQGGNSVNGNAIADLDAQIALLGGAAQ